MCSTHEAHLHYLWGCAVPVRHTLSTYERLLMNRTFIKFLLWCWNTLTDTVVCLTGIVHAFENKLELFVTNYPKTKQLPAHFYGHAIIVMNIFCFVSRRAWGSRTEAFISHLNAFFCIDYYCTKFSLTIIN